LEGLRHLRASRATVEEAARRSGYRSYGKFHRRVRHYTGLTPAAVRAYACDDFEEALDDWVPLRARVRGEDGSV
jgi:AraC-like DNA-binding protein